MKKILIISSNRLGDCILSSGLNKFFKDKGYSVTFACGPLPYGLFKFCGNINKIFSFKKKKFSLHWLYLWMKVIFNVWECVVDLRGSAISFFLFTKKRLIYKNLINDELHKTKSISLLVTKRILSPNIKLNLKTPKSKNIDNLELIRKKYKNIILVAPCANWIGKTWPIDRFVTLIKKLRDEKTFSKSIFIIIGAADEKKK